MIKSLLFIRLFWRDVKSQKKRMALTLMAVLWGTLSIVLLLAFGNGLSTQLDINRKGLGDGIMILWGGQTTIPYEGLGKGRRIRFYPEDLDMLAESIPEIKQIGGEYNRWGQSMTWGKNTVSTRVNGCYPSYETMRAHYAQAGGRFINKLDFEKRRRVVFLGNKLAVDVFGEVDPIGKTVTINNLPFTVIGVMKKKMQMGSYSGPDESKATVPASTFKTIWGNTRLNNIVLQPHDPNQSEFVKKRLYEVFGSSKKFNPDDKSALSIWDVIESAKMMNKVLMGMQIFFGVMGFFSLSIAGVGVANIMYASIKERTVEIGVKMALGAKKRQIMGQFILEAMLIATIGGALGLLIAQGLCSGFNSIELQNEALGWLGKPFIDLTVGAVTVVILTLIGLVSGYFPARKAATVNPVESLRYE